MVDAGYIALVIALLVAVYLTLASFLGAWKRIPELTAGARYGLYTVPVLLSISTLALVYAFVTNDFSVRYVAENSNLAMPDAYTWVALYAGNAGSLLFLALVLSILAALAGISLRRRIPQTAPYAVGILGLILTFFLGIVVFMANPLERLPFTPMDGQGINPLLVHFGMFIHPPVQMLGLISVAIPFSIAVGALLAGQGGRDDWVDLGRRWGMISWVILTIGLLLGAWWAYTILGWGGYWAWDPVENSALMPWLAMTAFVHSIMVQKRRGMFRMWNMVLIIVGFTLAQVGMFINRGGPGPSVHSFAQSSMGWLFLFFMAFTLAGSLAVFVWRASTLKSRGRLESMLSRESAFLTQNVLFLVVAFVTLWGTVFPIFSDVAQGAVVTVGRPFFDRVNGPLLLALVFLMGVGPLLPWRLASARGVMRTLRYPAAAGVVAAVALVGAGMRQPVAVLALAVCAIVVTGVVHEWIRGTRSRHRKGEGYVVGFGNLLAANRPRYGGYIVHLSIVMLAVGAMNVTGALVGAATQNEALGVTYGFGLFEPDDRWQAALPLVLHSEWSAGLVMFWQTVVVCLLAGYVFSYYFSASAFVYMLMRRVCDGQQLDEIWQEGELPGSTVVDDDYEDAVEADEAGAEDEVEETGAGAER